ncbi:MAG: hypothetical protein ACLROI_07900 [Beduini sp.]|uniref:hypothetical protein n=1 Tax=Beduini sp. TaxID=1922300 RepID=UPI0011C91D5D
MNSQEINKTIAERYQKWSKINLKIGLVAFVVSFIIIALNTGNSTLSFISSIGLVVCLSCLVEYFVLKGMCAYMLNRKDKK